MVFHDIHPWRQKRLGTTALSGGEALEVFVQGELTRTKMETLCRWIGEPGGKEATMWVWGKPTTWEEHGLDYQKTPVPGYATNLMWDPMTPFHKMK